MGGRETLLLERIVRHTRRPGYVPPRPNIRVRRRATTSRPLLPSERAAAKERKQEHNLAINEAVIKSQDVVWQDTIAMQAQFGGKKTVAYWYRRILQQPTLNTMSRRRANRWNAYLRGELKSRNEGTSCASVTWPPSSDLIFILNLTDRAEGDKLRIDDIQDELRETWNTMSKRQKEEATKDYMEELEEQRNIQRYAKHNTENAAFRDAQGNVAGVKITVRTLPDLCMVHLYFYQLGDLATRTDVHSLLFTFHGSPEAWAKPSVFYTHESVPLFFNLFLRNTIASIATRLDSYIVSGAHGECIVLLTSARYSSFIQRLSATIRTGLRR